ncbi:hypothetical protein [Hymenobacter metallicola]|uniref:Uncharacterized protein n=1 Tax=Hymenobacter metallicola TaxID=2563114 RepID=A0A4Z0QBH5_9BACT|nr:hypothetical protein [Hymenobacter metallicola]TGE27438.1 hypothetical protein E5K02_13755 [Hymenobacter metallicola]
MKKNKKTKPAKKKSLLSGAAKSLKKLGKGRGLGKLSTTQKVVGGALLLGGIGYLAQRRRSGSAAPVTTDVDANTGETLLGTEGATV